MTRKQIKSWLDEKCLKDQNALEVGMKVRNADGWTGTILALHPANKRNEFGIIGLVSVRVDDMTENTFPISRRVAGDIFDAPAGQFKPLASGLKFSCNDWR